MAEPLTFDQIRGLLADSDQVVTQPFDTLQAVSRFVQQAADEDARDVVIRLLEHRDSLADHEAVVSALVRHVGLFPYAEPGALGSPDQIALEAHRPIGRGADNFVFHADQGYAYRLLMNGENLILSASTSFGKSLIIDAMLASERFNNCAVIVPTIALLDETRRRLVKFDRYKTITHPSQRLGDRNLFVMTQERFLEFPGLPAIDFFAIDEFYKLDLTMDPDRASLLNQVFYRLVRGGGQFYLLGPSIERIPPDMSFEARFLQTPFRTVALDTVRVQPEPSHRDALVALCRTLADPTIIYCRSPGRAREVAGWLVEEGVGIEGMQHASFADWVGNSYHPAWRVATALHAGIGVHHGRLPRALAHAVVRIFNEGGLRFLVCTSTLIEGVNTAAKNVVVFDNQVALRQFDFFTFNNIRGRSGRMSRHFVGNVYLFHDEPADQLPFVDMPVFTQGEDAPTELLIQMDESDLTVRSEERLAPYVDNDLIPIEILRANTAVDLEAQLAVAAEITENLGVWHANLFWTGFPRYEQLVASCHQARARRDR